ncbi:DUF4199 domain-containing protein [Pontibacter silvestris]|uniref:DUF4199 domain-containing protein n=1 Tax=Pontibacter silvestris TaxID=2305183 RepID=A0ABW4WU78_9BACT|nr:DUF4199 domain-containing protein [Pontibacter silvestris]MCC9136124.1 DUF4199 domain-containing protein [Pontibacter silvestris]
MFNQAIIRVGVRYGVLSGIACFVVVLVLYFVGVNPFGNMGRISFVPIPVFILLAIKYYKKYNDTELGFLSGLRVGLSTSFYTALTASLLVLALIYLVGPELLQRHITEMQTLLTDTKEEQIAVIGQENFDKAYEAMSSLTPGMLAADDFIRRLLAGAAFALVGAVFFRK